MKYLVYVNKGNYREFCLPTKNGTSLQDCFSDMYNYLNEKIVFRDYFGDDAEGIFDTRKDLISEVIYKAIMVNIREAIFTALCRNLLYVRMPGGNLGFEFIVKR